MKLGKRLVSRYSLTQYVQDVGATFNGNPLGAYQTYDTNGIGIEPPRMDYDRNVAMWQSDPIVYTVVQTRLLAFSEVYFQWLGIQSDGQPGKLFGTKELDILETPWINGTTGDLLAWMELDASFAGNAYIWRDGDRLQRLRPDLVDILIGDSSGNQVPSTALGAEVAGYVYYPDGRDNGLGGKNDGVLLAPGEVAHYAPIPDPNAYARGMSWLQPVIREVSADQLMVEHRNNFFQNAATPNMIVKTGQNLTEEQRNLFERRMSAKHEGSRNAYKTMLLEGGADATVVGSDLSTAFVSVQSAGENRITSAAGVPGIIAGLKAGLDAATYSNYGQARRRFLDLTVRPLWRMAAGALATLVKSPSDARLWYDDRYVAALQEDAQDAANIAQTKATTVSTLVNAGFDPDAAAQAASTGLINTVVGHHSGLTSVQLVGPDDGQPVADSSEPEARADDEADPIAEARQRAEVIQKVYLGVGAAVTTEEARLLLAEAGIELLPDGLQELEGEPAEDPVLPVVDVETTETVEIVEEEGSNDNEDL